MNSWLSSAFDSSPPASCDCPWSSLGASSPLPQAERAKMAAVENAIARPLRPSFVVMGFLSTGSGGGGCTVVQPPPNALTDWGRPAAQTEPEVIAVTSGVNVGVQVASDVFMVGLNRVHVLGQGDGQAAVRVSDAEGNLDHCCITYTESNENCVGVSFKLCRDNCTRADRNERDYRNVLTGSLNCFNCALECVKVRLVRDA